VLLTGHFIQTMNLCIKSHTYISTSFVYMEEVVFRLC